MGRTGFSELTRDDLDYREALVSWGRDAIAKMDDFWSGGDGSRHEADAPRFTFYKPMEMREHVASRIPAGE